MLNSQLFEYLLFSKSPAFVSASPCPCNWSKGCESQLVSALKVGDKLLLLEIGIEFDLINDWRYFCIIHEVKQGLSIEV